MEKLEYENILEYVPDEERKEIVVEGTRRKALINIEMNLNKVKKDIDKIINLISTEQYHNIDKKCRTISKTLYNSAEKLDKLPKELGMKTKSYDSAIEDNEYIKFEMSDSVLHLTLKDSLPGAINFNKDSESRELINYNYYKKSYISSFAKEFENGRYIYYDEKVVIYVINHYIKEIDVDNYYYKYIIDAIKTFLLPDDSPKWCALYTDAIEDSRRYAEVYIVPQIQFIEFITKKNLLH